MRKVKAKLWGRLVRRKREARIREQHTVQVQQLHIHVNALLCAPQGQRGALAASMLAQCCRRSSRGTT